MLPSGGFPTEPAMRLLLSLCALLGLAGCGQAVPATVTLYCYETLADAACRGAPDPGRGNRLLAVVEVPLTPELALRLAQD